MTHKALTPEAHDTLFRKARTHNGWLDMDVNDAILRELHELLRWAPTSANCSPARFVFVKSKEAKERLMPHLDKGNVDKTMAAPVTVLIGYDLEFYEYLPKLFPHTDAKSWFVGKEKFIESTAFRNSALQGAYLIMAARSLGLDCGPMSGFNAKTMREEFFPGTKIELNFICNLGYGDDTKLHPRSPRFEFDEVCEIL